MDEQQRVLGLGLPGKKSGYKSAVTNKLAEFANKKNLLDQGLEGKKTSYKDAIRNAITPLFANAEGDTAADWVLTQAGADAVKAAELVTWILNGWAAGLKLAAIEKILTIFTAEELKSLHTPTSGADAKAKNLLLLLKEAKGGEAAKFTTLIKRDESSDFPELLTFFTKAGTIDAALLIFSKKDIARDVNKLMTDLTQATIPDTKKETEDYLKHKGKAADGSFLKAKGISKVDSEKLLAKAWVVGAGEPVAHIYGKSSDDVDQTIEVLDLLATATKKKTPADVKKWLDYKHTFANIHSKVQADKNQQFWSGETCGEPGVTSRLNQNDTVDTAIANSRNKVVGQFHSGGGFGNLGNASGQTGMVLPDNVGYREYDVKPYKSDPERGSRRVVVGGSNYYFTSDHYQTFERFRS